MNAIGFLRPAASPDAARGALVLVGLHLVAIEDALARIEEVRFARDTPQAVREALGEPLRAAKGALASAAAFAAQGEAR